MQSGLVRLFTQHKVAANLLMFIMLIAGGYSLSKINFQYFPSFGVDIIYVGVSLEGATAEDVETSITKVLEQDLKTIENIKNLVSNSSNNLASISIEFEEGTDMRKALDQVKDEVGKLQARLDKLEEAQKS